MNKMLLNVHSFRTMDLFLLGLCIVTIFVVSSNGRHLNIDDVNKSAFGVKDDSLENLANSTSIHIKGNIVKRSSGPSMVYIAMYKYDLTPGKPIFVTVDSTMTKLFFKAEATSSKPVLMATNSLGLPVLPKLSGYVTTVEGNITATDYGKKWTFTRMDHAIWDVTIMCESTVGFTYELIDNLTGVTWKEYPVIGKAYTILLSVPNFSQVKRLAMAMLYSTERSTPIDMRPLKDNGGGKYEFSYVMKDQSFMIGIDGQDLSNNHFQRLSPDLIIPVDLKLIIPPYTGVFLYENKTFIINVTVQNIASKAQDLDIRIVDDKNFAQHPLFLSPTIKAGENWTGQFVLKGGRMGETTNVTITARPYFGNRQFGTGPSEVRQFTVYTNLTTTTSTTSTTTTAVTNSKTNSMKTTLSSAQSSNALASSQSVLTTQAQKSSGSVTSLSQKSTLGAGSLQPTVSSGSLSVGVGSSTAGAGGNGPVSASAQSGSNPLTTPASASSKFANVQPGDIPTTTTNSAMVTNLPVAGGTKPVTSPLDSSLGPIAGTATQGIVAGIIETGTVKTTDQSSLSGKSGQGSTESSSSDNGFNKGDVLTAAIAAGIAGGVLVGIVGMIVMGVVFKGAMNKANPNPVKPKHEPDRVRKEIFRRSHVEDHTFAWT